jgi:zinc protease
MIPRMMRRGKIRTLGLVAAAALLSCAPVGPEKYSVKLPEFHAAEANGLRVIVLPDPSTPLVEVDVHYEVGANEDPVGKSGIAHVVEHIMFQQKPAGEDKPELFKAIRQMAIFFNAFTTWDRTHYMDQVRKEDLEPILAIESARMFLGCQTVSQAQFEREREVVRNEYRQNWGTPDQQVLWKYLEAVYPEGHPYRRNVIGTDDQLVSITLDDVCQFMKDYYTPSRATLIIAGNVTPEEVAPLVNKYFAGIPRREPKPRAPVADIKPKHQRLDYEMDIDETQVTVMWPMPPTYSEDGDDASIARGLVAGQVAREGDQWDFATGVGADVLGGELAPVLAVTVRLRSSGDTDKALDAIWRAAKGAYQKIASDEDFKEAIAGSKAELVMGFENLNARTVQYGDWSQFRPDGGYLGGELARLGKISGDHLRSFLKSSLDPDKAVIVVVKAKNGAQRAGAKGKLKFDAKSTDQHDSDVMIDPAEAKTRLPVPSADVNIANVKRFTMGNGMKVVLLPSKATLPIFTMNLLFGVGSVHESPSQAGLAQVAGERLDPPGVDVGTGGEAASADVLGRIGADLRVDVGAETTVFSVRGLNIYETEMVKGLERLIKAGDYSQEGIERYRKYLGFAMKRKQFASQAVFRKEFAASVFGPDHPYTLTGEPTVQSLGNFGRDKAMDFKNDHYTASNATLIVAGSFDAAHVEKVIRDNFGEWDSGHTDKPVSAMPAPRTGPIYLGVGNEELPSVTVRIGYPAPSGIDGQYGARRILAEMLGSRMGAVREKLGSSYGVGAGMVERIGPGLYVMQGQIDAERAGISVAAMRAGVDSLRKGEDFDAEFAKARRAVLKDLLTSSGASFEIAGQLLFLATYALPDSFYDKLMHQVAAASAEQVKALIAAELRPELEVIGILGPKATVEKAFVDAGLKMTRWVD